MNIHLRVLTVMAIIVLVIAAFVGLITITSHYFGTNGVGVVVGVLVIALVYWLIYDHLDSFS